MERDVGESDDLPVDAGALAVFAVDDVAEVDDYDEDERVGVVQFRHNDVVVVLLLDLDNRDDDGEEGEGWDGDGGDHSREVVA